MYGFCIIELVCNAATTHVAFLWGNHDGLQFRGWVAKQVGKNWNDVYSEVCSKFDRRSFIKDHVHQHIFMNFVEVNTKFIDGKVCVLSRWDGWVDIEARRSSDFYVHPVTGVLCSTRKDNEPGHAKAAEEKRAAARNEVFRVHNKDAHLYFENGQWWLYFMADIPELRLEYRCPWWWTNKEREAWTSMTLAEQEQSGQRVWVRPEFETVQAPAVPYGSRFWQRRDLCTVGRYYFAKRVANQKVLKSHNLLGTAEFVEKTMSHREASKYR
jgi:hypothetical protein